MIYPDPAYRAVRHAVWQASVSKMIESGGFQDADEAEMRTMSGDYRYAQVRLALVEGYHMYFINDLTARRQAEMALRLTQYAVDHNPVMIFRIDMEGRFVYANDAACSHFGYSLAEMLNLHIWDIAPTISPAGWVDRATSLREQNNTSLESIFTRKSGVSFPVEVRIHFVEFSRQRHFFVYAYDITDRKADREA